QRLRGPLGRQNRRSATAVTEVCAIDKALTALGAEHGSGSSLGQKCCADCAARRIPHQRSGLDAPLRNDLFRCGRRARREAAQCHKTLTSAEWRQRPIEPAKVIELAMAAYVSA